MMPILFGLKKEKYISRIIFILLFLLILIQAIASIGDIVLYKYWESNFSIRAFSYLKNLGELFNNISFFNLLFVFSSIGFTYIIFYFLFKFIIRTHLENYIAHYHIGWSIGVILFLIPTTFLVLRGGFREIPRNQSDAFFSSNRTYNIAAINSTWNFFNVLVEHQKFLENNPYKKMSDKEAMLLIHDVYRDGVNSDVKLFTAINRPTIVLITLEGVSAELFKIHNQDKSYMPYLESLIDSSYYFTRAYSVGFRTEQGIAALLSGTLSTPFNNITDNINTLPQIPSIIKTMRKLKYRTHFIFGGNVEFANMRAYLTEMQYDTIIDIQHFDYAQRLQKLGVPDEYLFKKALDIYQHSKSASFYQIMTQSTHEPYDIPHANPLEAEKTLYKKSALYLDLQLRYFIENARKFKLFQNTIFIICSDHSHRLPEDVDIAKPERYHIPFIIYSPLLKNEYKGFKDTLLFAQQNFPATLSYLMNWKERNYLSYSKNHFSTTPKFTFSSFVNGYLFQRDTQILSYDYVWRPFDTNNLELVKAHKYPQAIMQMLVEEIRGKKKIQ